MQLNNFHKNSLDRNKFLNQLSRTLKMFEKEKPQNNKDILEEIKIRDSTKSVAQFDRIFDYSLDCEHYQYELRKYCGLSGRLKSFVRAEEPTLSCQEYQDLYLGCLRYQAEPGANMDKFLNLKRYENDLISKRIESIKRNDVWTLRDKAPSDWNAPLPEWCASHLRNSYWHQNKDKLPK